MGQETVYWDGLDWNGKQVIIKKSVEKVKHRADLFWRLGQLELH